MPKVIKVHSVEFPDEGLRILLHKREVVDLGFLLSKREDRKGDFGLKYTSELG